MKKMHKAPNMVRQNGIKICAHKFLVMQKKMVKPQDSEIDRVEKYYQSQNENKTLKTSKRKSFHKERIFLL